MNQPIMITLYLPKHTSRLLLIFSEYYYFYAVIVRFAFAIHLILCVCVCVCMYFYELEIYVVTSIILSVNILI